MQDKKLQKIKQHYTVQIDGKDFKIMNHILSEKDNTLRLITKIKGQHFPMTVCTIQISTPETTLNFKAKFKDGAITPFSETWRYEIESR